MADGQQVTFDDIQASLNQYRQKKQSGSVPTMSGQKPPAAPRVPRLSVQKPTKMAAPPKPPVQKVETPPKPQGVLTFDSLTQDLNQRRQQGGDQTPVAPREPKNLQISGQENWQNMKDAADKVSAWKQRQQERAGNWVAGKLQQSPEQVKAQLDKTPAWQFKLAHNLYQAVEVAAGRVPDLTPYSEMETRKTVQKSVEAENKLMGWADKQVVSFMTDPINIAMMASGTIEFKPLLSLGIDSFFTASMAKGAYQGFHAAYEAGKAANWDVFATTGGDHFEFKPEAAAFWEAMGDAAVSTFFAGMGLASMPHRVGMVREYGKFNDPKITGINKSYSDMNQSERAIALANVQKASAGKGLDKAARYQQIAQQYGLKPKPKDQAEAAAQYAEATREARERIAAAEKHATDLFKADLTIAFAPDKVHREAPAGVEVPELPPDESNSPESREALRKVQMGEELTPAERAIGERETARSRILLNLEPEQTAGLSDKDFQRWSRQYSQEEISDGDDLLKLVKGAVARGDIEGAEWSLKRGIRFATEDPLEIPDDVADTPRGKREKAKANAERNAELAAKIAAAEKIVKRAQTAKQYEMAPAPVLGEVRVPKSPRFGLPKAREKLQPTNPQRLNQATATWLS